MKNALLIAFSCIAIQAQAQHFDLSINGGITTTTQTGDMLLPATSSRAGTGYAGSLNIAYVFKTGLLVGIGAGLAEIYVRQDLPANALPLGNNGFTRSVYFGTPSINANARLGYQFSLKKSAFTISIAGGYISNSNFHKQNDYPVYPKIYIADSRGYEYGGDIEYQYRIGRHSGLGLLAGPMLATVKGTHVPDCRLFSFNTQLTFHYNL